MKPTIEQIELIAQCRNFDASAKITDDMDYGEKHQAVVGQSLLLTVGTYCNADAQIWLLDVAELPSAWYFGCGFDAHANFYAQVAFKTFADALGASNDIAMLVASAREFAEV